MHVMPWNVNYGGLIKRWRNVENVTNNTEISWDKDKSFTREESQASRPVNLALSLSICPTTCLENKES